VIRLAASIVAALVLSGPLAAPVAAQAPAGTAASPAYKQGDACVRKTDANPGVVKRDACGRWYCGRRDIRDVAEFAPNLARDIDCTWKLEGTRCMCRKPVAQQDQPKPAPQQPARQRR
jgi:hypothetical protein